jgi:hypothetical protein
MKNLRNGNIYSNQTPLTFLVVCELVSGVINLEYRNGEAAYHGLLESRLPYSPEVLRNV